jgi:hypothetical protein
LERIERSIEKDILIVLIRDAFYVGVAMLVVHGLAMEANYLNEGNAQVVNQIMQLSNSYYIAVYILSTVKSLLLIATRSVHELAIEVHALKTDMDKQKEQKDR